MIALWVPGKAPRIGAEKDVNVIGVTASRSAFVLGLWVSARSRSDDADWPVSICTRADPWCVTPVYHQPPSGAC
jgi:hypothetical protein